MNYRERFVKEALRYALGHLYLDKLDLDYVGNQLLHALGLDAPGEGVIDAKRIDALATPDAILDPLREGLRKDGKGEEEIERLTDHLMGLVSPLPSAVSDTFDGLYAKKPSLATGYLYRLSIENDYIKKSRVDKNILFPARFKDGADLEISINMSKPEKNNADIAKALKTSASGYPKCALCPENEGYFGSSGHASRGNLRFVPLSLSGKTWYLQYSPYVYYPEHCIVFLGEHHPMHVDGFSIAALLDFAELFPHYFIGSNSDLPIVGGSILTHEHFQGGGHELPLLKAPFRREIGTRDGVSLREVDFYDTCLCLVGGDKDAVAQEALRIHESWKCYDDPGNQIISRDGDGQHSTSTLIAKKRGEEYYLYLILRNNRTTARYPGGIFHAHKEFSHIKKEGIGLIEAAGLFILPSRLKRQSETVERYVAAGKTFGDLLAANPDMEGFGGMFASLKRGYGKEAYIGGICRLILENVAVYKGDEKGRKGLDCFLGSIGYGN